MGDKRHWLLRFCAEILVLALLATAFVGYRFDLGERWFGWGPADPATNPAAVLPPEGLRLPAAGVVPPVADPGPSRAVDPARVESVVRPLLRKRVLGPGFSVRVSDLSTGKAVFRQGPSVVTPASTTKLVTAAAALESLGPMARFRTTVRWNPTAQQLVLVGGGDPFLASTASKAKVSHPDRADIETLAQQAVHKLRSLNVTRVRLAFDDSYFSGPAVNPHWPASYVPESVVPPISSLWVDQGVSPDGPGFLDDPAAGAAQAFRDALRGAGLQVGTRVVRATAPEGSLDVASALSAPVGEIVERTLGVSDNQAAEVLARHVGLAERQEGSFEAGSAAILDVVRRLGVPTRGDRLHDGSGLSRENRLSVETLADLIRVVTGPDHPQLRQVLTGLPVAGFTGSLRYRFDTGPAEARGRVRAKTGTLTGVHALAGVADGADGGRMAFVVVADRVGPLKDLEAQVLIDRIVAALGACNCGVGSSS